MTRKARRQRQTERNHAAPDPRSERRGWLVPLVIALITFAVFAPAMQNDFVTFDDDRNFVNNMSYRGLGLHELRWMWTTFHTGHYVPFTWMTLGLDFTLWGMRPAGYHFTNIVLHAGVAALAYLLSRRLLRAGGVLDDQSSTFASVFPPALAALLFAVHPLRVESVAWVTERRDVLSALLALGSVLAHFRAIESNEKRVRYYSLSIGLYACALLSKATVMTLPALLLVLDVYPLRRVGSARGWWSVDAKRAYLEKIPYLVLSIVAGVVSLIALPARPQLALLGKIAVSAYGLSFYLWKTLLPMRLSPLYPMPQHIEPTDAAYLSSVVVVIAISACAWVTRRRWPAVATAWTAFVIVTLPMLGAVQNGPQIAADRYTYHAGLALTILAAVAIARVSRRQMAAVVSACAAVLLVLGALTARQLRVWHDSIDFWSYVVALEPTASIAQNGLADALENASPPRLGDAIVHYRRAVELSPEYDEAHNNLGTALAMSGNTADAVTQFQAALAINPALETAHFNWGNALFGAGDFRGAIEHYEEALRLKPDDDDAASNRRIALERARRDGSLH